MPDGGSVFTAEGAWDFTTYDLFVELGPRDDACLLRAVDCIWSHPLLHGPFADREREPDKQELAQVEDSVGTSYGVATLPGGASIASETWAYRAESDGARDEGGTDWLQFSIPLGSLYRVWPETIFFPFLDDDSEAERHVAWQELLEALFVDVARHLFDAAPFRLAIVGHAIAPTDEDFQRWWSQEQTIAASRWDGFLCPVGGELQWHPPTQRGGWVLSKGPGNPSSWSEIFAADDDESEL